VGKNWLENNRGEGPFWHPLPKKKKKNKNNVESE
jgi:hypothetical protein